MTTSRRFDDRRRQLGNAPSGPGGRWWGALTVLAFVLIVVLATVVIPPLRPALDFRRAPAHDAAAPADGSARVTRWAELVPAGWDPGQQIRELQQTQGARPDADAQARAALRRLRDTLDAAPTDPALDGRSARIAGYVVPIESAPHGTTQFLLVPYFGACIHSPPPPANQIVHVVLAQPRAGLRAMDAVWVRGTLHVARHESHVAVSGYRLAASAIGPVTPGAHE
ncbi:MAG: DUF3299 domain-containing protein [Burkholderiaceae bacterium]|nr:DUF3299 domain-containing protein [Burkholderiaceae bacterium]